MQLGIGSYAYRWALGIGDVVPAHPMQPADLIRRAAAHGVPLVQLADNVRLDRANAESIAALRETALETGVAIELGLNGVRIEKIQPYLDLAQELDARLVRIAPDAEDARRPAGRIAGELRDLRGALRENDIVLAIENHFHFPSPLLRQIVEEVDDPRVGVCLDVANSIAVGEWPDHTIAMLAPFAVNLHLKDYEVVIDTHGVGMAVTGTPLGSGRLDIGAVFAALERPKRDVNVILEHWLPLGGGLEQAMTMEEDWLAQSIAVARPFLPGAASTQAKTGDDR